MDTQLPLVVYENRPAPAGYRRVCDLPTEERPLYRLHRHGVDALSTAELLALVLGTSDGPGVARDLLHSVGSLHGLARAGRAQLRGVRGIGEAQAARLLACLALGRRLQEPPAGKRAQITSPTEAADLLMGRLGHLDQEELHVVLLNTRNRVLDVQQIYRGSLNTSVVRTGEIFRPAVEAPAAAVIVAHNHPTGDPAPSPEDINVTRQLVKAGKLLDIPVLDHLIIAQGRYTSLKERNLGFD